MLPTTTWADNPGLLLVQVLSRCPAQPSLTETAAFRPCHLAQHLSLACPNANDLHSATATVPDAAT